MPEESADILPQDLIWVNAFDHRCGPRLMSIAVSDRLPSGYISRLP
jgi:hypothetical protein